MSLNYRTSQLLDELRNIYNSKGYISKYDRFSVLHSFKDIKSQIENMESVQNELNIFKTKFNKIYTEHKKLQLDYDEKNKTLQNEILTLTMNNKYLFERNNILQNDKNRLKEEILKLHEDKKQRDNEILILQNDKKNYALSYLELIEKNKNEKTHFEEEILKLHKDKTQCDNEILTLKNDALSYFELTENIKNDIDIVFKKRKL
jgi:hypothetical protein